MNIFRIFRRPAPAPPAAEQVEEVEISHHRIGKHDFWTWDNPMALPLVRRLAYYEALYNVTLQVRHNDLDRAVELMREKLNAGEVTAAAYVLETLSAYRNLYTQRAVLFEVAAPLIVMRGEQPLKMTAKATKRKRQLCESDDKVAAFFLATSLDSINETNKPAGPGLPEGFFKSLRVSQVESLFLKSIGRNIWGEKLEN